MVPDFCLAERRSSWIESLPIQVPLVPIGEPTCRDQRGELFVRVSGVKVGDDWRDKRYRWFALYP